MSNPMKSAPLNINRRIGKPETVGSAIRRIPREEIKLTKEEVKPLIARMPAPHFSEPLLPIQHAINKLFGKDAQVMRRAFLQKNINIEDHYICVMSRTGAPPTAAQLMQGIEFEASEEINLKVRIPKPMLIYIHDGMLEEIKSFKLEEANQPQVAKESRKRPDWQIAYRKNMKIWKEKMRAVAFYIILKAIDDQFELNNRGFNTADAEMKILARKLGVSLNTVKSRFRLLNKYNMTYSQCDDVIYLHSVSKAGDGIGCPSADVNYTFKRISSNLKTFEYALDVVWEKQIKSLSMIEMLKRRISQPEERKALSEICGVHPLALNREVLLNAQIAAFHVQD
ncbi:MAG TPA: hypothetical protein VK809_03035, partial [Bacteroidia bacterium]|nr:hypothetical protein [Bacteroidia bacterium]